MYLILKKKYKSPSYFQTGYLKNIILKFSVNPIMAIQYDSTFTISRHNIINGVIEKDGIPYNSSSLLSILSIMLKLGCCELVEKPTPSEIEKHLLISNDEDLPEVENINKQPDKKLYVTSESKIMYVNNKTIRCCYHEVVDVLSKHLSLLSDDRNKKGVFCSYKEAKNIIITRLLNRPSITPTMISCGVTQLYNINTLLFEISDNYEDIKDQTNALLKFFEELETHSRGATIIYSTTKGVRTEYKKLLGVIENKYKATTRYAFNGNSNNIIGTTILILR